ncbi:MAG: mannose-1-phosphate guanylyltransferase/mannose-6-phosphate isomerase, partial [Gammaproteobacteria bacterium]
MDVPTRTTLTSSPLIPVLMSGGSGTRLWPLSREAYPKQFLALTGALSLLQNTALRARALGGITSPVVIGGEAHRFLIAEQLQDAGIRDAVLLLEPEGRDTAPAAAVAAHYADATFGPHAVVLLMAADHVIDDLDGFVATVRSALPLAQAGRIVTFGIQPTSPATGFGYIERGAAIDGANAYDVKRFVEKPDAGRARAFVDDGGYYWNSGMFLFRVDRFLAELDRLERPLSQCAHAALTMARHSADGVHLNAEAFASCRKISLDYAVMEKLDDIALVPLDVGWDDVGSWTCLERRPATDEHGNRAHGDVLLEDCACNLVHADSRLVTMIGVEDHVVVETADAVLVAPRARVQEVKRAVEKLKHAQRPEVTNHARVYRPWGYYETIGGGDRFQVKRIMVKPGHKLSLQMHHHRAEHWVVVRGTARVTCGEREFLCTEDQSTYIPLGTTHRLENPGMVPLELIEVQSGAYLGEDDIVRFD